MNAVLVEFAKKFVVLIHNVELVTSVKVAFVLLDAALIQPAHQISHVLTDSVWILVEEQQHVELVLSAKWLTIKHSVAVQPTLLEIPSFHVLHHPDSAHLTLTVASKDLARVVSAQKHVPQQLSVIVERLAAMIIAEINVLKIKNVLKDSCVVMVSVLQVVGLTLTVLSIRVVSMVIVKIHVKIVFVVIILSAEPLTTGHFASVSQATTVIL